MTMRTLTEYQQSEIRRLALDKVESERLSQIQDKGYDYDHDDRHGTEELAAAAAFFLLPGWLDADVCTSDPDTHGLRVVPLLELVGEAAWDGIEKTLEAPDADDACLDARIDQLTTGLALGLAELERCMRMRELRSMEDPS